MKLEHIFGDVGSAAIAGALGGVVRWITQRNDWREGFAAVIVGSICAIYLGPIVAPIMEPIVGKIAPSSDADGFASFITGLGGISLAGFILDIINYRRKQIGGCDEKKD
jgi:hypothetical protein